MAERRKKLTKNHRLFKDAGRYLVGGVDSPVRSFRYVGGEPVLIERGRGSKVYDYDGNEYIDYVLSWGAVILGHGHPAVLKGLKRQLNSGLGFGTTNESEIRLAGLIRETIPFAEKVRFVNSGTEAVMGALRLARGHTGRDKIVKFENAYHGHADYLLAKSGSGLATLGMPSSAGVPKDFIKDTIVAPHNDAGAIEDIFKRYGREIAGVLVEPVGGNYGVIPPDKYFLKRLRHLTRRYGALLIFDEVITGYRFRFGSAAEEFGIIPDLISLGKIIGGGLPIGAYAGSAKIMDNLAPLGKVYQASTFSGNPIVMRSGISTLATLKALRKEYERLKEFTAYLSMKIKEESARRGIDLKADYFGTMFSIRFKEKAHFAIFYRSMLEEGIYLAPSEYEANFLSFAHTKKDIDRTIMSAKEALWEI